MKKILAIVLAAVLCLSLVACSGNGAENSSAAENSKTESSAAENTAAEGKAGFAVLPNVEADEASVTFDTVYAGVIVDGDGKIVACNLDEAQLKAAIEEGALGEIDLRTKDEKKEDYGMVAKAGATYEWYQQADAFEQFVIGKTAEEVRAIPCTDGKTTDADLLAGCTITVTDFIEAVATAAETASAPVSTSDKIGFAITTENGSNEEKVALDTDFAMVTLDAEGKVTSCQIDAVQAKLPIVDGAFDAASASNNSKKQLGDDYGMVAKAGATYEWYQQAANFETYVTGKTADEVSATALTDGKASDADLSAGCTITITGILANTEKAIAAAK